MKEIVPLLVSKKDELVTTETEKAEVLNEFFVWVFTVKFSTKNKTQKNNT